MKKLVLVLTTVTLVMVMVFCVSAKSKVKSVRIKGNPKKVTLKVGDKKTYKVKIRAAKGCKGFKVKTSNKKVVKVTKKKNKITVKALKRGKAKVTVLSKKNTRKKYKLIITVKAKNGTNYLFDPEGEEDKKIGKKLNQLLDKHGTLDAPEIQQMIQDDIGIAKKTGYGVDRRKETGWYDYSVSDTYISISKDVKTSFECQEKGGMIGYSEGYHVAEETLRNGQVIYNLGNKRIPIKIPKGYKVYINIKGHIDKMSYLGTDEDFSYYRNTELYKFPTNKNYDLVLTDKDNYINDIAYYCEAREGCNDNPNADFPLGVFVYKATICATVYDSKGNLVAYGTEWI